MNDQMKRLYAEWLNDAPEEYKQDGFFIHQRPVAVTTQYGQNQCIGSSEANGDNEDRQWDEDCPGTKYLM